MTYTLIPETPIAEHSPLFPGGSLLPLILDLDPYPLNAPMLEPITRVPLIPLHLTLEDYHANLKPIGFIGAIIVKELALHAVEKPGIWQFYPSTADKAAKQPGEVKCVAFTPEMMKIGSTALTGEVARIVEGWRKSGAFRGILREETEEMVSVHADLDSHVFQLNKSLKRGHEVMQIERSAVPLFGKTVYSVALNAYEGEGEEMKIWVQKRSLNRFRNPGLLDTAVAGNIPAGGVPLDQIIEEAWEEAGWDQDWTRKFIRAAGATSFYIEKGGIILESASDLVFDLKMPSYSLSTVVQVSPRVMGDDVESFELMTIPQVFNALRRWEFKKTGAMVMIDFLIRHGFITSDNEPNYLEIISRCHRPIPTA